MPFIAFAIVIAFSGIIFQSVMGGELVQKIFIASIAIAMIIIQQPRSISKESLILISPFVAYTLYSAVSAYVYSGSLIYVLAATSYLLIGIFIYIWLVQTRLSYRDLRHMKYIFYIVLASQIIFAFIKLELHGIDEKFMIGTMSHTAGQLGFLIPAVFVPILIFLAQKKQAILPYILIALTFAFGIINEKRTIVFLLPIILAASILLGRVNYRIPFLHIISGILISVSSVLFGISLIPSLNPQSAYGGDISISHAISYAEEYLTMDYGGTLQDSYQKAETDAGVQVGRITLWISVIKWIMSQDLTVLLFGHGFGSITPSIWLHEDNDLLFDLIGTRGAISAAASTLIETGVLGFILMLIFFIYAFIKIIQKYKASDSNQTKKWFGILLVIYTVFCFDFFFYSTTLLRTMPLPIIFFSALASIEIVRRLRDKTDTKSITDR